MDYAFYKLLDTIHANQLVMIGMLRQVLQKESEMAIDLTTMTAEVESNTNVTQSVVTLVKNLAEQIANIPPSSDPTTQAALDALATTLAQNDAAIAAAVTANTSSAPGVASRTVRPT